MGIKTENLKVGLVVKNYRELCKLLGADIKDGKSKRLQIKDWERYFRYSRDGNKYIIEEIYDEPAPKLDKRKDGNTNNNKYGSIVQELIVDLLLKNTFKLFAPLTFFLKQFDMVNINYNFCDDKVPKLAKLLKINDYNIYDFYNVSRGNLRGIFETALKRLEKIQFIKWTKVPMVCITQVKTETNELNTLKLQGKGNTYVRCIGNTIHRKANPDEIRLVRKTEEKLLNDRGYKNISQVILAGKQPDFRKELQGILFEKGNIDYMYYNYEIYMEDAAYEQISKEIDTYELKHTLNNLISKNMMENAKNRHLKIRKKYSHAWGEVNFKSKKDKYRYNEAYPEIYSELVAVLIDRDAKDIREKIGKVSGEEKVGTFE